MFHIKTTLPFKNVMPNVLFNFKFTLIFYEQLQNISDIKTPCLIMHVCDMSIAMFKKI